MAKVAARRMGLEFRSVAILALAVAVAATPARSASFDCAKAHAPDEVAVCGDRDLSELDVEMAALWFAWSRVPMAMGSNAEWRDGADAFLKERAHCGDAACLRRTYEARIAALKTDLDQWLKQPGVREGLVTPAPAPASLPPAVEALIDDWASECRRVGGFLVPGADRPLVMSADLDGDGQPDFVLDPQNLKCSASASLYLANNGSEIKIALSSNGYRDPIVVGGGAPQLLEENDGSGQKLWVNVAVWVEADNCRVSKFEQSCWEILSWKSGQLETSFEARPLPTSPQ
jgi:uncharacterized protein